MSLFNYLQKGKNILKCYLYLNKYNLKKFNIGSANTDVGSDWFSSDIDLLNITRKKDWTRLLFFSKLDNIMAEHVWEHLSDTDTILANKNCYNFLKKNGRIRLAVPDGFHIDKDYINYVRPGGNGAGADDHKILYNYRTMKEKLEHAGFHVELLEYWDENGKFHFIDWNDEAGRISRSRRYDERNQYGNLIYTSLIVDAVKL
jgi:predicted SAM-dependent methyltransferase